MSSLREAVEEVIAQDLFPSPNCAVGTSCAGCFEDAMEGKRRLVAALAQEADAVAVLESRLRRIAEAAEGHPGLGLIYHLAIGTHDPKRSRP